MMLISGELFSFSNASRAAKSLSSMAMSSVFSVGELFNGVSMAVILFRVSGRG